MAIAVGAALVTTLLEGIPPRLPGLALGSGVLLHAERALAMFAALIAVVTLVIRAAQGDLPVELSTTRVRYDTHSTREIRAAVDALETEVRDLRATIVDLAHMVEGRGGRR